MLSRRVLIRCATQCRNSALARCWHFVQTDRARLERLDLDQRAEERQGGFRALVEIHAVDVQAVTTTARVRIVDAGIEVVLAQKPAKCASRFDHPEAVTSDLIGFAAGRNGGMRLQRLLIETSPRFASSIEPVRANGSEVTALGALRLEQPAE